MTRPVQRDFQLSSFDFEDDRRSVRSFNTLTGTPHNSLRITPLTTETTLAPSVHQESFGATSNHDSMGQTDAQSLASQYRQSAPATPRPISRQFSQFSNNRQSSASWYGQNLEDLPYSDDVSASRSRNTLYESDASLVHNAADAGHSGIYQDFEYADPFAKDVTIPENEELAAKKSPFDRFFGSGNGKYPLQQRVEDKKRGIGRQKYPIVVWALTIAMVGVFINELVVNDRAQGTPVSFKPVVNYMLGPSESALINLGARFPPCMKVVEGLPLTTQIACLNDTANPPNQLCSLEDVCGFGGFDNSTPDQWFRFITAIFLHAGFVHIGLNMLAQLTVSAQIEREMGSAGFIILYFAAGIFGNVLGGNFSLVGAPSLGASGAIFGTVAVTWVDLFAHWQYQYRPVRKLMFMTIELLIGIAIGYIPYVDNFAHLGGLCMGLLVGTILYPIISPTRRHKLIVWGFRLAAVPLAVVLFVVLIRNFYTSDPYAACSGCRYLSCIPTSSNNYCQGTGFTLTGGESI